MPDLRPARPARNTHPPRKAWSDHEIRRLLRKVRVPGRVENDPLARELLDALGTRSAVEALKSVAQRALVGYPPLYWAMIREVDFGGATIPQFLTAQPRGGELSMRTLYRYRVEAVAAIRCEIDRVTERARRSKPSPLVRMRRHRAVLVEPAHERRRGADRVAHDGERAALE